MILSRQKDMIIQGVQFFYRLFKENKEYEMTIDGWVSGENGVYPFADIGVRIKKL